MKTATFSRPLVLGFLTVAFSLSAYANTQVILRRDAQPDRAVLKGIVDLTVDPDYDDARVNIVLDGEKIAESLHAPYKVTVDFGPVPVQHKIGVTVFSGDKKVQWHETVNRGHQPLTVKVVPVDLPNRIFEARATAPDDDPIVSVALWDAGKQVGEVTAPPYR